MNQQGKFYSLFHFICNNCRKEFYNTNAYSPPATNLGETYCINCANLKYFSSGSAQNNTSFFSNTYPVPPHLTNQNTNSNQIFNQPNFKSEKTNNLDNQNKVNKQVLENRDSKT